MKGGRQGRNPMLRYTYRSNAYITKDFQVSGYYLYLSHNEDHSLTTNNTSFDYLVIQNDIGQTRNQTQKTTKINIVHWVKKDSFTHKSDTTTFNLE